MAQKLQPEQQAREAIDRLLEAAGWVVQDFADLDLTPGGVAVREVKMKRGYSEGLPKQLNAPVRPLPFMYVSTGVKTLFTNRLDPDPDPRSRAVFSVHRPETLADWLKADNLYAWMASSA